MANILDYLDWRGDLTLEQAPFNEVDNLILAELSFVDFRDVVPAPGGGSLPLEDAADDFFRKARQEPERVEMGALVPNQIPELLEKMAASRRFGQMRLGCYAEHLDTEQAEQFAALAVELTLDLEELSRVSPAELLEQRYRRFRRIGVYEEKGCVIHFTEV